MTSEEALLQIIENTPMHKRHECRITGKILPIGEDGLTDPEREYFQQIKEPWQQ